MRLSTLTLNEPESLHVIAAITSSILMLSIVFDAIQYINWNFLSAFTFSGNNLKSVILSTFLILAIIFWILSILNKQLGSAIAFLFLLSLSITCAYISNPVTPDAKEENLIKSLILVSLSLIFIESIARLQQSEKRFETNKQVTDKISRIYYGSNSLRIFKTWITPSFIILAFIGMLAIILVAPEYIAQKFDFSNISHDRLKYFLSTSIILLLLVGIFIVNSIVKEVYSSIAIGETEKWVEVAYLYNEFIKNEKMKNKIHTMDLTGQNEIFARVKYIAIVGLIIAFGASDMNVNQLHDATLQFFDPSLNYQEHTFLNGLNEKILDIEKNIYDIDDIIAGLNDAMWS